MSPPFKAAPPLRGAPAGAAPPPCVRKWFSMPLDQRAIFCSLFTVPLGERLFYRRVTYVETYVETYVVTTLAQLAMTIFGYGVSKWTTPRVLIACQQRYSLCKDAVRTISARCNL